MSNYDLGGPTGPPAPLIKKIGQTTAWIEVDSGGLFTGWVKHKELTYQCEYKGYKYEQLHEVEVAVDVVLAELLGCDVKDVERVQYKDSNGKVPHKDEATAIDIWLQQLNREVLEECR